MLLSFSLPIRISRSHTHILLLSLARTRAFAHSLYLPLSLSHCPSKCRAPSSICGLSSFCGCVNKICKCVEYIHTSLLPPCAHFSHTLSLSGILALAHARSLSLSVCHSLSLSLRVLVAEFKKKFSESVRKSCACMENTNISLFFPPFSLVLSRCCFFLNTERGKINTERGKIYI